jgi:23S rRNA (cytosine1962-C5)-methyltransferase
MTPAKVTLHPGREKPILNGNPWVYSGAIDTISGLEVNGQVCEIYSSDGNFLATGYVNPQSKITCRIFTRERIPIDYDFFFTRISKAILYRTILLNETTNACRLINSEGDFLPGLICDWYGDGCVVQFLTSGIEHFRKEILDCIEKILSPSFVVERSDAPSRKSEGLPLAARVLSGNPHEHVQIREHGLAFLVDIFGGQKTGFYLDQRESRHFIKNYCAGKRVLNLFSYTGSFSVGAGIGGAKEVISVDTSVEALSLARNNMSLNGLEHVKADYICEDVFRFLNTNTDTWDVIIVDPPAFASRKTSVARASRGYKDINMRALRKLNPDGILFTYSCSHYISPTLFRQIIYAAVVDSGRQAQLISHIGNSIDHPFNICHIEGEYLKGIILRIIS